MVEQAIPDGLTISGVAPAARLVPLAELQPAPWNPREITEADFAELCRSVEADPTFLWLRPVLAQGDGRIYAGNQRYRAVEALGGSAVPAIVENVEDVVARRRALVDNNNSGVWSTELLRQSIAFIREAGGSESLGFRADELAALLAVPAPAEPPDAFPTYGADLPTDYCCPSCHYEWSGAPRG
jgi:hypothetical protein